MVWQRGYEMDQDFEKEMEELKEERAENLKRSRGKKNMRSSASPARLNPEARYLVLSAIGVFALVVILVLFSKGDSEIHVEDYNIVKTKIGDLEKRLTELEATEQKIAHLQSQLKELERSMSKSTGTVASTIKKRRYHEVRKGDTLSRIARKYDITVEQLCRLNKITPKTVIRPGQKLLVSSGT